MKDLRSVSTETLFESFNNDISYLQSLIISVNQHEGISFLHDTPIIPGVGLLGSIKQKKENIKFLNILEIKLFEDKGLHQLTQVVAERIYDLCSIQAELKRREAVFMDEMNKNDAFAYNYETSQGDCQLWGILTNCWISGCFSILCWSMCF